jgi:hypothetical protein
MQRSTRIIQLVFEPLDLLPQAVPFLTIPIALAPQLLLFALLPFELGDQLLARCGAPARLHALVMPRLAGTYKPKLRRSRRSDGVLAATTR